MKFTYLWVDFFTVIIPFLFSFHPKLKFYRHFKSFFSASVLVALVFIIWDVQFTKTGVWGFNPAYISGIYIFNLPIEELLFFFCIPFACVFTYHCLNLFYNIQWRSTAENIFVICLAGLLLLIGIYFHDRLYTSYTFISLSVLLLLLKFVVKVSWLDKFITIYAVLLIPFFIVNGVLTGSGLEQPVVWYNNEENLGIRLLTIPVEDVFYGFELLLLNVFLYEFFKSRIFKQKIQR